MKNKMTLLNLAKLAYTNLAQMFQIVSLLFSIEISTTQQAFTYSKLAIETQEKKVKYVYS